MKTNLSQEFIKTLVEASINDCGKRVYVGHGSLTEHEILSSKYVLIRGKDGSFQLSDLLSAKDYVEWEGSNYFIVAKVYFDPGNYKQVVTQLKFLEYVGNKDGALHATFYYRSIPQAYVQDLAMIVNQISLRLRAEEND